MKFQYRVGWSPGMKFLPPEDFTLSQGNLKYKPYVLQICMSDVKVKAFRSAFMPQGPASAASASGSSSEATQPAHTFDSRITLSWFFCPTFSPPGSPFLGSYRQWEFSICRVGWNVCSAHNWSWLPIAAEEEAQGSGGQECRGSGSQPPGKLSAQRKHAQCHPCYAWGYCQDVISASLSGAV